MQNVFSRVPTFAVGEQKRERASRRDERRWGRKSKSCQFKCWYYRCSTVLMQWSQTPSYKASFRLLLKYVVINNDTQRNIVPDMSTRCLKPGEGGRCPGWTPPGFTWRSSRLDRVSSFRPPFLPLFIPLMFIFHSASAAELDNPSTIQGFGFLPTPPGSLVQHLPIP